jgi:hypothetical protein
MLWLIGSFETFVHVYETAWRHFKENCNTDHYLPSLQPKISQNTSPFQPLSKRISRISGLSFYNCLKFERSRLGILWNIPFLITEVYRILFRLSSQMSGTDLKCSMTDFLKLFSTYSVKISWHSKVCYLLRWKASVKSQESTKTAVTNPCYKMRTLWLQRRVSLDCKLKELNRTLRLECK